MENKRQRSTRPRSKKVRQFVIILLLLLGAGRAFGEIGPVLPETYPDPVDLTSQWDSKLSLDEFSDEAARDKNAWVKSARHSIGDNRRARFQIQATHTIMEEFVNEYGDGALDSSEMRREALIHVNEIMKAYDNHKNELEGNFQFPEYVKELTNSLANEVKEELEDALVLTGKANIGAKALARIAPLFAEAGINYAYSKLESKVAEHERVDAQLEGKYRAQNDLGVKLSELYSLANSTEGNGLFVDASLSHLDKNVDFSLSVKAKFREAYRTHEGFRNYIDSMGLHQEVIERLESGRITAAEIRLIVTRLSRQAGKEMALNKKRQESISQGQGALQEGQEALKSDINKILKDRKVKADRLNNLKKHQDWMRTANAKLQLTTNLVEFFVSDPNVAMGINTVGSFAIQLEDLIAKEADVWMYANLYVGTAKILFSLANRGKQKSAQKVMMKQLRRIQEQLNQLTKIVENGFEQLDHQVGIGFEATHNGLQTILMNQKLAAFDRQQIRNEIRNISLMLSDYFKSSEINKTAILFSKCFNYRGLNNHDKPTHSELEDCYDHIVHSKLLPAAPTLKFYGLLESPTFVVDGAPSMLEGLVLSDYFPAAKNRFLSVSNQPIRNVLEKAPLISVNELNFYVLALKELAEQDSQWFKDYANNSMIDSVRRIGRQYLSVIEMLGLSHEESLIFYQNGVNALLNRAEEYFNKLTQTIGHKADEVAARNSTFAYGYKPLSSLNQKFDFARNSKALKAQLPQIVKKCPLKTSYHQKFKIGGVVQDYLPLSDLNSQNLKLPDNYNEKTLPQAYLWLARMGFGKVRNCFSTYSMTDFTFGKRPCKKCHGGTVVDFKILVSLSTYFDFIPVQKDRYSELEKSLGLPGKSSVLIHQQDYSQQYRLGSGGFIKKNRQGVDTRYGHAGKVYFPSIVPTFAEHSWYGAGPLGKTNCTKDHSTNPNCHMKWRSVRDDILSVGHLTRNAAALAEIEISKRFVASYFQSLVDQKYSDIVKSGVSQPAPDALALREKFFKDYISFRIINQIGLGPFFFKLNGSIFGGERSLLTPFDIESMILSSRKNWSRLATKEEFFQRKTNAFEIYDEIGESSEKPLSYLEIRLMELESILGNLRDLLNEKDEKKTWWQKLLIPISEL